MCKYNLRQMPCAFDSPRLGGSNALSETPLRLIFQPGWWGKVQKNAQKQHILGVWNVLNPRSKSCVCMMPDINCVEKGTHTMRCALNSPCSMRFEANFMRFEFFWQYPTRGMPIWKPFEPGFWLPDLTISLSQDFDYSAVKILWARI